MKSVKIDDNLYEIVKRNSYKNKTSINAEVNKYISNYLIDNNIEEIKSNDEIERKEGKEIKNFSLRIDNNLLNKIEEEANKNYCSINKYINIKLHNLYSKSEDKRYTDLELEKLHESNYQLSAIGNNLNQITKKINEGKIKTDSIDTMLIVTIKDYISDHIDIVRKILEKE